MSFLDAFEGARWQSAVQALADAMSRLIEAPQRHLPR